MAPPGVHGADMEPAFLPPSANPEEAARCRREFYIMSITFGINHATVTTPLLYASSVLTDTIGNFSSAILYGCTLVCSLFLSNILYSYVGPKKGLVISMFAYTVYVFLFALATGTCSETSAKGKCLEGGAAMAPMVYSGAIIGGLGAGLLWTCQGAFYGMVCEKLSIAEQRPKAEVTADLAGTFGLVFLGNECLVRAMTTVFLSYVKLGNQTTFFVWTGCAFGSTIIFGALADNLQPSTPIAKGSVFDKLLAAVRLWKDPKTWLLQSTNITFGFAVAWLGAFVAPNVLTPTLNSSFIGFAGAFLSGLAALLAKGFGPLAATVGKGPVLTLGCVAFICLGLLSKSAANYDEATGKYAASSWSWGVFAFYGFMGIGRAVYESTNKAIIADFFPGEQGPGAFANVFVFGTAASTAAFILGALKTTQPFFYLLLIFAAVTVPCFVLAGAIRGNVVAATEANRS